MRAAAASLILLFAACTTNQPETSTEASALLTETNTSVIWHAGGDCSGPSLLKIPCNGNFIWPAGLGITSAFVMYRGTPATADGTKQYLAFVVWNGNTVGRILQAQAGTLDGIDLRITISNITATRSFGLPDQIIWGQGGDGATTPTPQPHPNVDGGFTFGDPFLNILKLKAAAIQSATQDFLDTPYDVGATTGVGTVAQ